MPGSNPNPLLNDKWAAVVNGTLTGVLKASGNTVAMASAGIDYLTPSGSGTGLSGVALLGGSPQTITASTAFTLPVTLPVIDNGGREFDIRVAGAVGDGITDNTAAIQATITAAEALPGSVVLIPRGHFYCASGLTITGNITLRGCSHGDAGTEGGFGHAGWTKTTGDGSVLCTDMTSGVFIDTPTAFSRQNFENLIIVGVGDATRTTTGVRLGFGDHGHLSYWSSVAVCNFKVGGQWNWVEQGGAVGCMFVDCDTGLSMTGGTNGNSFKDNNIVGGSVGIVLSGAATNTFIGGAIQGVTDTSVLLIGGADANAFIGVYFESHVGNYAIDCQSGDSLLVLNCTFSDVGDNVRIAGNACQIYSGKYTRTLTITGINNFVWGDWQTYVDSGTSTIRVFNGAVYLGDYRSPYSPMTFGDAAGTHWATLSAAVLSLPSKISVSTPTMSSGVVAEFISFGQNGAYVDFRGQICSGGVPPVSDANFQLISVVGNSPATLTGYTISNNAAASGGRNWLFATPFGGSANFQMRAMDDAFSGSTTFCEIERTTGTHTITAFSVLVGLKIPAFNDSSASNSTFFLGLQHLDAGGKPYLTSKDDAGSTYRYLRAPGFGTCFDIDLNGIPVFTAIVDTSLGNGSVTWSGTTANFLKARTPAGTLKTLILPLVGSATLDFPSTASGATSDLTIAVTGAAVNDTVALGPPATVAAGTGYFAWVSAADTVTVRFWNISGAPVDPASAVFTVRVLQP